MKLFTIATTLIALTVEKASGKSVTQMQAHDSNIVLA